MSSPMPKLVYNEAKSTIIQTRIVHQVGDYERNFNCKWPQVTYLLALHFGDVNAREIFSRSNFNYETYKSMY